MSQSNQIESKPAEAEYVHVGAHFRDLRENYRLSVQQVSERLHIRSKYIEAIEAGDMQAMPGKVYTQGYIQSYAEFLGLDPVSILEQYEGLDKANKPSFRVVEPTEQHGLPAWQLVLTGFAALVIGYVVWSQLGGEDSPDAASLVEAVPERIQQKADNALILTPENRACLSLNPPSSAMPCFHQTSLTITGAFILQPVNRSIMELK